MPRPTRLLLLSLSAATAAPLPEPQEPRVWTVFCAECTNNFDYKSIGVYWSHRLSGMPGGVTRLLACDEEQLKRYKGLNLGNTFVHRNYGRIQHKRRVPEGETHPPTGSRAQDSSPSYNKPGSIMEWVMHSEEAKSTDYVLYIDADMLLRKPLDPIAMGVKKGVVVSEHVGYLDTGIRNGLPAQFLPSVEAVQYAGADVNNYNPPGPDGKRHAAGGWYMFFHIDDIRTIAPRWLHYEIEVRTNPQKYWSIKDEHSGQLSVPADILTGDAYVGHGSAPWISEMCLRLCCSSARRERRPSTSNALRTGTGTSLRRRRRSCATSSPKASSSTPTRWAPRAQRSASQSCAHSQHVEDGPHAHTPFRPSLAHTS